MKYPKCSPCGGTGLVPVAGEFGVEGYVVCACGSYGYNRTTFEEMFGTTLEDRDDCPAPLIVEDKK